MWFKREKRKRKRKNDDPPLVPPRRIALDSFFEALPDLMVKAVAVTVVVGFSCFVCSIFVPQVFYTFFGDPDIEVNPESQGQVPTVETDPTSLPATPSVWDNHVWLSQAEARRLREHANVNNLAYLEGGNVLYNQLTVPFALDQGWEKLEVVPVRITALSVTETFLTLNVSGQEYQLNVLMPFVFSTAPTEIYLVDRDSEVWQLDSSEASFVEAPGSLTIELAPNPNLSFTINER